MSPRAKFFGKLIRSTRRDLRLSLREVARRAGTSPATLSRIETAAHEPSLFVGVDVCRVLGLDAQTLLTREVQS